MARIPWRTVQKKIFITQNNHDGAITHLEQDILECEVKWALESITTNKASEGDEIPAELFSNPKREQPWVFIGRTDAEAETPILWPPHEKG